MLAPASTIWRNTSIEDRRDRGLHLRGTLVVASDFPFNKMVAQTCGDNQSLNVLAKPVLSGSTAARVAFWASSPSSLVCSVSVESCRCALLVESSMNSEGDFAPDNFCQNSMAACVLA